ncbi:hypothetical protein G6O67_000588 [Ophiocordyceps sinensis]|uniref:F-box domain-containing protein n=1 Tax=Ophiocordyceps sinensis TaxID=72228 RepID=A0A8H4PZG3_9HYPO|nr:hypothetical protein G6O67_000588 [Ophiocordyceps sinensis]
MTSPMDELPNEMLAATLALLSSRELAVVALVSRRLYSVGVRVLYRRLVDAVRLPDHELILECYHPSAKISTPYLACRYLGTRADGGAIDDGEPLLADLFRLYSSFRPVVAAEEDGWPLDTATRQRRRRRRRRLQQSQLDAEGALALPQQLQAGHQIEQEGGQEGDDDDDQDKDEMATQDIDLDQGELFSQLCTVTNVVKRSARRGLLSSHANTCHGVVRVWRKWLADMAAASPTCHGYDDAGSTKDGNTTIGRDGFLWVDAAKSVGLKFRVVPAAALAGSSLLLSGPFDDCEDDEPAVSYTLVYQELVVRSSMLLSAVEASASPSTKAVIIAQFEGHLL